VCVCVCVCVCVVFIYLFPLLLDISFFSSTEEWIEGAGWILSSLICPVGKT